MTYLEALDSLHQAKHLQASRFRELCAESNPDTEQRDAYRQLVINLATGEHRPPSLVRQAITATQAAVRFAASGFAVADDAEQERRLSICRDCEYLDGVPMRCLKCGCALGLKSRIAHQHCPINKW